MISDYYLDTDKQQNGVKLPLFDRDGKITQDWILVKWAWSDEMRAAKDRIKRNIVQRFSGKEGEELDTSEDVLDAIVVEVGGWSFEDECTPENVRAFLEKRPDIAERIDIASANTRLFFPDSGASS